MAASSEQPCCLFIRINTENYANLACYFLVSRLEQARDPADIELKLNCFAVDEYNVTLRLAPASNRLKSL
jgi:hypothetical protein